MSLLSNTFIHTDVRLRFEDLLQAHESHDGVADVSPLPRLAFLR